MAVGITIDATIALALADMAGDVEPAAVQALQGLWENDFLPVTLGSQLLLFAAGFSIVLHRALPRRLGYVAVGVGLMGTTPMGEAALPLGGLWIVGVSVALAMRGRTGKPAARGYAASSHAAA